MLDQMAAEALKRVRDYVSRATAQNLRRMREQWRG